MKHFSESISMIGPRMIFDPRNHTARRVVWAVLVLAALVILGCQLYERIDAFVNNTISVTYDIETPKEQVFPTVTICNLNSLKRSYLMQNDLQPLVQVFTSMANEAAMGKVSNHTNHTDEEMQTFNYTQLIINSSVRLEELIMFNASFYKGELVRVSDFQGVITPMGMCYYYRPPSPARAAGRQNGMRIMLNTLLHEYSDFSFEISIGWKIFVNQYGVIPDVFNEGIRLTPNAEYDIGISQRVYKFLEYPTGICNGTGRLRYYPEEVKYTKNACLDECMADKLNSECSCYVGYFPHPAQSKVCSSMHEFTCAMRAAFLYHMDSSSEDRCNCGKECDITEYTLTTFNSKLNRNHLEAMASALPELESILPNHNGSITINTLQDNLALVWIYFSQLRHEKIEQKVSYTVWAMLSDVGGALGLFLGSAIFTLFEVIDLIFIHLCHTPKRRGSAISVTKAQRGDPNLANLYY